MSKCFPDSAAALVLLCAWQLSAQSDEFAKRLVVMIKAGSSEGAGIICGLDSRGVYIATADHVVRPGISPVQVSVKFYNQPDREFPAEVLTGRDADLDIAVIRVLPSVPFWRELQDLPFQHKSDLSLLKRGSEVYLLGNPGGRSWRMSVRPETLAQIRGDLLEFESNLITGGHSGGALLTAGLGIAGMLRSDKPPYGEAVSIDRILERFKRWGYPADLSLQMPRLTTGGETNCHLQPSGEARCWSAEGDALGLTPWDGFRFLDISAGRNHVCGIITSGTAVCWGRNTLGQLGVGDTSEWKGTPRPVSGTFRFTSISAGEDHSCALDQEGRAYCWGGRFGGNNGNDSRDPSSSPVAVSGGLRFQSIAAGMDHTCGVTENGDLYCWGGILGSGDLRMGFNPRNTLAPLRVVSSTRFRTVSAGSNRSCAVAINGDGYCWGSDKGANVYGFPFRTSLEIVRVPGRLKFRSISAGRLNHACGVTTESRVYCWGHNDFGQLGDGGKEDSVIPVAVATDLPFDSVSAGFQQTCAVSTGSTYCWGRYEGTDGKLVRRATLGGSVPAARPTPARTVNPPAALADGRILERYVQSTGGATVNKMPPREWKGTLENVLFGFPNLCAAADVSFLGQPGGGYTLQLECRVSADQTLLLTLKSARGAKSVTGQVTGKTGRVLDKSDLDMWGVVLDREASLVTESLAYPGFVAGQLAAAAQTGAIVVGEETVVELAHPSGRIDKLNFDTGSGRLAYLSAIPAKGKQSHLEISFDQYKQVNGVIVPFELRLNTKAAQSVLKLREIRF